MMSKHSQMKVIVLRPGAVPAPATRLYNTTTDALLIAEGSGTFYTEFPNSGNPAAIAAPTAPIKFIQNRDTTNDPAGLYSRPLEESQWISPQCLLGVKISQQNASFPSNNLLMAGDTVAGSPAVPILDEFTYRLQVSAHGDREDLYNSVYNTPTAFGTYTSPDWTAYTFTSGTLTNDEEARAITLESMAYNFNGNNQGLAVMICLDSAATVANGAVTVLALSTTVTNGTKVVIGYTLAGQAVTIKMDNAIRESFVDLEAAHPGMKIRPYLVPGTSPVPTAFAPATAGVVTVAGQVVPTDNFLILAIDEGQATYDYRLATKRRVTLGLLKGFDGVLQEVIATPKEGTGLSRQLSIMYKANENYNQTARPHAWMSYHVEFPNEIVNGALYDLFFVEHCHTRVATSGMPSFTPHTTVIAVANTTLGAAATNPFFGNASAAAQRANIVATLNSFDTTFALGNANLV